jgi:hypothetical protein
VVLFVVRGLLGWCDLLHACVVYELHPQFLTRCYQPVAHLQGASAGAMVAEAGIQAMQNIQADTNNVRF